MKLKEIFNIAALPVFIASLCCVAPIVFVLFGLSTVAFAASLSSVLDGQYRWLFVLVGLISLGATLVFYFRKRGICTLDQAKIHRNEIMNKVLIVVFVSIVGYIFFFYIFLGYIGRILGIWT